MPSLYRKNKLLHMLTCPALHDSPVQHVIRNWNKTCWWIESWGKGIEFNIIEVLESSLSIRYISLDLALSISWLIAFRLPLKYCPIVTICHVIDFVLFDTKCYSVATKSWFPAFPWIKKWTIFPLEAKLLSQLYVNFPGTSSGAPGGGEN